MNASTKQNEGLGKYMPLAFAAGIGSMLGSGIIVGLSSTITVWQDGLGLDTTQVGLLSGILTFAIAFGSLFGGRLADKIARIQLVSATAGFGSACFDCSLAISSSHTSLGVLYPRSFMGVSLISPTIASSSSCVRSSKLVPLGR